MESCGLGLDHQRPHLFRNADLERANRARVSFRAPISKLNLWFTNTNIVLQIQNMQQFLKFWLEYQLTKWNGRCDDINLASITDEDECKDAAINAGESYKGLSKDYPGFEYYNPAHRLLPTGCFLYGNHGVYFNSNPPCSSFCAGRYFNTKAICKQGISNQFSRLKNDIRTDIVKWHQHI